MLGFRKSIRSAAPLAATAILLSLAGVTAAQATVLLTGSSDATGRVTLTDTGNIGGFTFGFHHVQVNGACAGCITFTQPGGGAITGGSFSLASSPFNFITDPPISNDPTENNHAAIPFGSAAPGVYYELFGGFGQISLGSGFATSNILGSEFEGFTIFAAPGSNTATYEFNLFQPTTSSVLSLPPVPLYLDISGTTTAPMHLDDLTPGQIPDFLTFTPFTLDFTVTLTTTPYSPVGGVGTSGAPEPASWALAIVGFAGAGLMLRRRRTLVAAGQASARG